MVKFWFPVVTACSNDRGLCHDGEDKRSQKNKFHNYKKDQKNLIIENIRNRKIFRTFLHKKFLILLLALYKQKIMITNDIVSSSSRMLEKSLNAKLDAVEDERVEHSRHLYTLNLGK